MSEAKHTPRPLFARCPSLGNWGVYSREQGELSRLASIEQGGEDVAVLFAAAPETAAERDRLKELNAELLEALKDLTGRYRSCLEEKYTDTSPAVAFFECNRDEGITKARAAIAKAKAKGLEDAS